MQLIRSSYAPARFQVLHVVYTRALRQSASDDLSQILCFYGLKQMREGMCILLLASTISWTLQLLIDLQPLKGPRRQVALYDISIFPLAWVGP